MTDLQNKIGFNDNMDQQIVLDSDRRFTSVSSQNDNQGTSQQMNKHYLDKQKQQISTYANRGTSENSLMPDQGNYNLSNAGHPIACIATIFFKALALFTYLFMGIFMSNVIIFISVTVLSALDFWTVKNVTGRLLVGLRWWSYFDEKGEEVWKFESFDKEFIGNSVDKAFFWTGQIASTVIWALFLLIKFLSLSVIWGVLTGISFGLCALNLYGYYKCRGDHKNKLSILKSSSFQQIAGKLFF